MFVASEHDYDWQKVNRIKFEDIFAKPVPSPSSVDIIAGWFKRG
jgi:hypothetical protein